MKKSVTFVCLLIITSATYLYSQEYKFNDMKSFNEGYLKAKEMHSKNESQQAFESYLDLIKSFHLAYNNAPDQKSRAELEKKLGDIWFQVGKIGGQSGNIQAAITGYYYACGYDIKEACSSIKIFFQTKIHNDRNLKTLPGFGKCIEGDCIDGWGVYQWDSGAEYEGEWLNGVFSGMGSYVVKGEGSYWLSNWRNGDINYKADSMECPYTEGYEKFGNVKFGKMGETGLKHFSTADPIISINGDEIIFDNATYGLMDAFVYSAGHPIYTNFTIEATIDIQGGPATQGNGIVFRSWGKKYYLFNVTDDGRVAFYTCTPDAWTWHRLVEGQTTAKTTLPCVKTDAPNTLKIKAIDNSIELFVNGTSIGKFEEPMQTRGKIGVYLSEKNKVVFKGFKITSP